MHFKNHILKVVLVAFRAGITAMIGMMIYWNLLAEFYFNFAQLPSVAELIFGNEHFSWLSVFFYNLQNFLAAFFLSGIYYMASRTIDKRQWLGLSLYVLFASCGFLFFVMESLFTAADVNALLLLFLIDDVAQSLFIMTPIVLMAPGNFSDN